MMFMFVCSVKVFVICMKTKEIMPVYNMHVYICVYVYVYIYIHIYRTVYKYSVYIRMFMYKPYIHKYI